MPQMNRRTFAAASLASLAFAGLARRGLAQDGAATFRNEIPGYGELQSDPAGLLDLPAGVSHRIISSAGEAMDDGYFAPDHFDGMACFGLGGGRVALVRNHELTYNRLGLGPARDDAALAARLLREPHFGRDGEGRVLPGGTSTIVYDLRRNRRERQWLSLAGTAVNCAGGPTPWGSWLTCEENTEIAPRVREPHGWVFEVPSRHRGLVQPVPLRGLGRFRHEAAAVDPRTGIVYLTEDTQDSLFYRFIPDRRRDLAGSGRLQALALADLAGADTRNWNGTVVAPRSTHRVRWIDLSDTHSPDDDLRRRGHQAGAALFARGEGIWFGNGELFFTCTSGGAIRSGQIFRYTPGGRPSRSRRGPDQPDRLELFIESTDPMVIDYCDNLTIAPWGHLIVCEDRGSTETCHLKGVLPDGRIYTLARLRTQSELAGVCFSPDGRTMFLNVYSPGRTLAITGPWDRVRTS